MNFVTAEEVLSQTVPKDSQIEIAKLINKSYSIVRQLEKEKDYFNSLLAKNILTYLSSIVVEIQLEKAIKSKKLPYKCDIVPNAANNHYHLEVKTFDERCIITVSQTFRSIDVPRLSIFRKNHSLSNQLTIDDCLGIPRNQTNPYYLLITHGHYRHDLKFINIGVPEPYISGWIYKISLLQQPYIIEAIKAEKHQEEKIENDIILEFKELIAKRVKGNER